MADTAAPQPPRGGTRWLPVLLALVVLIPLVRSCMVTNRRETARDSLPARDSAPGGIPVAPPDTVTAESAHVRRTEHKAHPAAPVHPDSARHKESLGEKIERLGGGPEPVTPPGQGAMGGEGPSGQAPAGTVTPEKPPTTEGAMGGDGPTGKK